jgi:hypothetical protein
MSSVSPVTAKADHWTNSSVDYMDLFNPDAPWPTVASHLAVFKFGPAFASQGNADDLKKIFADLRRRHIQFALETGMLTQSAKWPKRSEASGPPGMFEKMLTRLKSLGATPSFIAMDEPLTFSRWQENLGPNLRPFDAITSDLAANNAIAQRIFPGIRFGDEEAISADSKRLVDLQKWPEIYRQATGTSLAFIQCDLNWSRHAMKNLIPLSQSLKSQGVPFSVIYNGGNANTDEEWCAGTEEHYTEIETDLGITPDIAMFQSWVIVPSHLLPETKFGTMTNIIYTYLLPKTHLTIDNMGGHLTGSLTNDAGQPIPGKQVSLTAIDVAGKSPLAPHVISGVVPPGATSAQLRIRINTESAFAANPTAQGRIGTVQFQAAGSAPVTAFASGPEGKVYSIADGGKFGATSPPFPVVPGTAYTVTVPFTVPYDSESAGYVDINFKGDVPKGTAHNFCRWVSNEQDLGTVVTDASGNFQYDATAPSIPEGAAFRASFAGNHDLRASMKSTPY